MRLRQVLALSLVAFVSVGAIVAAVLCWQLRDYMWPYTGDRSSGITALMRFVTGYWLVPVVILPGTVVVAWLVYPRRPKQPVSTAVELPDSDDAVWPPPPQIPEVEGESVRLHRPG